MTYSMKTFLYRIFDAEGTLLYVGVCGDLKVRMQQHARNSDWWPQARRRTKVWYRSRPLALAAEREVIRTEEPKYNSVGTPEYSDRMREIHTSRRTRG